jgi:hypothetical protein
VKPRVSKRKTCHRCRSKEVFSFAYFEPDSLSGPYTMWTYYREEYFKRNKIRPPVLVPLCRKCMGG